MDLCSQPLKLMHLFLPSLHLYRKRRKISLPEFVPSIMLHETMQLILNTKQCRFIGILRQEVILGGPGQRLQAALRTLFVEGSLYYF